MTDEVYEDINMLLTRFREHFKSTFSRESNLPAQASAAQLKTECKCKTQKSSAKSAEEACNASKAGGDHVQEGEPTVSSDFFEILNHLTDVRITTRASLWSITGYVWEFRVAA